MQCVVVLRLDDIACRYGILRLDEIACRYGILRLDKTACRYGILRYVAVMATRKCCVKSIRTAIIPSVPGNEL